MVIKIDIPLKFDVYVHVIQEDPETVVRLKALEDAVNIRKDKIQTVLDENKGTQ